nr:MAG TPA: mature oligodendrocyte transmembrane protein [Caudoviricetes sp.]
MSKMVLEKFYKSLKVYSLLKLFCLVILPFNF